MALILTGSLVATSASDAYTEKEVTMKSAFKLLTISGVLVSAGFAALAQPQNTAQDGTRMPMMGVSNPMQHGGPGGMHGNRDPAQREAMMVKRQTELKAKLKISAEQEGAWSNFTSAMKPSAMNRQRPDHAELDKLTTPERIDTMRVWRNDRMAAKSAAMDQREQATKTLYGTLNAVQKKVFDTEHARMAKHHGGHRAAS